MGDINPKIEIEKRNTKNKADFENRYPKTESGFENGILKILLPVSSQYEEPCFQGKNRVKTGSKKQGLYSIPEKAIRKQVGYETTKTGAEYKTPISGADVAWKI